MSGLKDFGAPCNILIDNLKDHLHKAIPFRRSCGFSVNGPQST